MDEPSPRAEAIAGDATVPTTPLPWEVGRDRLAAATYSWLTAVRPDGSPHSRPVLSVWVDGRWCTTTGDQAAKSRHLAANGRCSVSLSTDGIDLVLEGTAAPVTDPDLIERIAAAYAEKYQWIVRIEDGAFDADYGAPTAGPPPYRPIAVTPHVVFGLGTTDELAPRTTRWTF